MPLRIIIVGAGIAGLTLASCFQHAGQDIDFLLLEGRAEIGSHAGAGVVVEGNGARILDQLGVLGEDGLLKGGGTVGGGRWRFRDCRGRGLYVDGDGDGDDGPRLQGARTGYEGWVCERRGVLGALYGGLKGKERVRAGMRVRRVEEEEGKVVVICEDGQRFEGDLVVGADGVNSVVRGEMWRLAAPGGIPDADRSCGFPSCSLVRELKGGLLMKRPGVDLSAEYRGLYGISGPVEGLGETGTMSLVLDVDRLFYCATGKDGRLYYGLVEKLPGKLTFPDVRKYTDAEAVAYAEERLEKVLVSDGKGVITTFGDVWRQRHVYALVNVEEGNLEKWTSGRVVLVGDIVHKVSSIPVEAVGCLLV